MKNQATTHSIQSISGNWFECFICYEKTTEDSFNKKVTEVYTVQALSFTEAEARIIKEMQVYISHTNTLEVKNINPAPYKEIFFSDLPGDDRWYLVCLNFITIDEKTEKEKKSAVKYLVQAANFDASKTYIKQVMDGTMIDYTIHSIKKTKIIDVFK